ncbi:MAG: hypothetical protein UV60_C0014G0007 [Parcubacteria group bacterium GW2011_GWA2_43_11]|nr:MAG: hypothetical protein UV60_C0014G0007 [Parcubacteria group bacterium GW2011_GWA2_43_11]
MKKKVTITSLFLRFFFSLLLVGSLVYKVSLSVIIETITVYPLKVVFLAVCIHLFATGVSALRWKILLPTFSYISLLKFSFVGQFYAMILPGQITGEIAKAYRASRGSGGYGGKVTASIAVDKIIGLMGVMFVTIFGLLLTDLPEKNTWIGSIILLSLIFVTIFVFISNDYIHQKTQKLLQKFEVRFLNFEKIFVFIKEVFEGFKQYSSNPKTLLVSLFLAVLFQALAVLIIIIFAIGLNIHIPIQNYFWIFGVVSLAVMLPITVAGLGVREGLFVYFLLQFNVPPEQGLILSLSVFSLQVSTACIGGFLELITFYKNRF